MGSGSEISLDMNRDRHNYIHIDGTQSSEYPENETSRHKLYQDDDVRIPPNITSYLPSHFVSPTVSPSEISWVKQISLSPSLYSEPFPSFPLGDTENNKHSLTLE